MPEQIEQQPPPEPRRSVRADVLERADKAWRVRIMGGSWDQAAEVAGYTDPSNCRRAVASVYGDLPKVERDELRRLWRDRVEVLWRQAVQDVQDRQPGAVTSAVRLADRAARLDGLDEPSRLSITPSDAELHNFVAAVFAARRDVPEEGDIFGDVVDADVIEDDES